MRSSPKIRRFGPFIAWTLALISPFHSGMSAGAQATDTAKPKEAPPSRPEGTNDAKPIRKEEGKPEEKKKPASRPPESATVAIPRAGNWMKAHERFLEKAKNDTIDVLFLGDSITAGWNGFDRTKGEGPRDVWDRYFRPRHAVNFGIGGDRTQHVLWRIENGEVQGLHPKAAVLMIGTNNASSNSAAEIADGITLIVKTLRDKLPETRILLLAVFPRGAKPNRTREKLAAVNEKIATLDDGKMVKYLDIGKKFLEDDGTISKEIMPDALHLSRKGYQIWADAIDPVLREMLAESAPGADRKPAETLNR